MITSQERYPKTLIDYMKTHDAELFIPSHDEWCLKLLNKKLIEKILLKKLFKGKPTKEKLKINQTLFKYENISKNISYRLGDSDGLPNTRYDEKLLGGLDNVQVYATREFEIKKLELGHVITKYGYNGFSQRLGFVDVFCSCLSIVEYYAKVDNKEEVIQSDLLEHILFFKINITTPSVSLVAREIEFFRDALNEIENKNQLKHKKILPLFVAKNKLPVNQFDTITFDEIIQMEKELE